MAAETALGEFRSVESRTTDSWRRALQDEREDFLRKVRAWGSVPRELCLS